MSVLERCPSYRESNKGSKERQGPTLSVRFTEVSFLKRCPLRERVDCTQFLSLTLLNLMLLSDAQLFVLFVCLNREELLRTKNSGLSLKNVKELKKPCQK